jgi:hypothetical protein
MYEDTAHPSAWLAVTHFQSQIPRFRSEFADEIRLIHEGLAARGILRSGVLTHDIQQACQKEMRRRVFAARNCVLEAMESDWSPSDADADQAFQQCFQARDYRKFLHTDIEEAMRSAIVYSGVVNMQQANDLERSISQVQVDSYSEAVAAIKLAARKQAMDKSINIHNHGTVGALQVGNTNTAHVVQNVSSENKALVEALTALSVELSRQEESAAIGALADRAVEEIGAHGMSERAASFLTAIGQLVQTLGAAPVAYALVANAAHAFGITLTALPH